MPAFAQKTLLSDAQLFKIDEGHLEGIVAVLPHYHQTPQLNDIK
jgi:aminoglycoside phosphotransferase family enzyme